RGRQKEAQWIKIRSQPDDQDGESEEVLHRPNVGVANPALVTHRNVAYPTSAVERRNGECRGKREPERQQVPKLRVERFAEYAHARVEVRHHYTGQSVDHLSQYPAGNLVQRTATDTRALAIADDHVDAAFRTVEQMNEVFEWIRAVRVSDEYPF